VPRRQCSSPSRQPVVAAATVQSPTAVNSSANGSSSGGGTRVMIIGAGRATAAAGPDDRGRGVSLGCLLVNTLLCQQS